MSWLFTSGGQSIGASASTSVLPVNIQESFNIQLISFRIDWFDLAVQGTLKSPILHHHLKASILWCSAFVVHPYITTGKTIALTMWIYIWKVMPLLLNMLSRFVLAFLLRSKHFLIS